MAFCVSHLTCWIEAGAECTRDSSFLVRIWRVAARFGAVTACFATIHVSALAARGFRVAAEDSLLALGCVLRWSLLEHEPRTTKTRVRATHNHNLLLP